jgi:hypothetical protein
MEFEENEGQVSMFRFLILIFSLCFISLNLFAQYDSEKVFTVPEIQIYQMEKGKEVFYEFDNDKNYFHLKNDTIRISPDKYTYSVPLSLVRTVAVRDGNKMWKWASYGALGAFVIGAIGGQFLRVPDMGGGTHDPEFLFGLFVGLVVSIPAGIIGGVLGLLEPDYYEIEFKSMSNTSKIELIRELRKHKIK